jgi:hypothetical protein
MTLWDTANFGVSVLGLCFSGIAAYQANSARDAVSKVLDQGNLQEDLNRIRALINETSEARRMVSMWMPGIAPMGQGRTRQNDVKDLYALIDQLRTAYPIEPNHALQDAIMNCATRLDIYIKKLVSVPPDETGWADVRNELQALHPDLEAAERKMKLKQLI